MSSVLIMDAQAFATDYSFLKDMSIKVLRELNKQISQYLPEENEPAATADGEASAQMLSEDQMPHSTGNIEGDGFASSEEAFEAYIETLIPKDYQQMYKTFSVETYVDNYKFDTMIEKTQCWQLNLGGGMIPLEDNYSREVNIGMREKMIVETLWYQHLNLAFGFSDAQITYLKALNPDELTDGKYSNETCQKNFAVQAATYGAEELESKAALLDISGEKWILIMEMARYGDRWYIHSGRGNLMGLLGLERSTGGLVLMNAVIPF